MFWGFYITAGPCGGFTSRLALYQKKGNAKMYGCVGFGLWILTGWLPLIITKLIS